MKRLVGGDFLLDVASLLLVTSTLTNITDKDVIEQLTNLKKFIPNPSMIKPIWVKLHDGDGKLVVTRGSLSVVDADEFELDVILNGYTLQIHVKFTQMLNEDEDPIDDWYIANNDAKYLFTTNNFVTFKVANVKNIDGEILSQLKCGDIIIKEDASGEHAYIVSYRGETGICLTYTDASVVETQSYDLVDDEWVYNSEDKTDILNPRLESIKDKDGHARFVEGEIDLSDATPEQVIKKYGCWSLCGSHLMIVLAISTTEAYNLSSITIARVDLPQWVKDKIVKIQGNNVARYDGSWWDNEELTFQTGVAYLQKVPGDILTIYIGGQNLTSAKTFRVQFDLLIDNE